ncbi:DMT family transporter [Patulibacter sp. NPDC049589]|uniref:DMT family transporter n=1 Tax=Patulibacter sp. NPDC049589 TaxID=3154731 RepID=UPI00343D1B1D
MLLGLLIAVLSAIATNASFLLKYRGAIEVEPVRAGHPLRSARALFSSRTFTLGWLLAFGAFALHAGALALAPISVVQAVLSGGLVFLAVLAERYFGFQLGRRQWGGVVITAIGLAVIALTGDFTPEDREASLAGLIAVEVVVFGAAVVLVLAALLHDGRLRRQEGLLLGIAAGAMFGVSDIAVKYLTGTVGDDVLSIVSPWTGAAVLAGVVAFYASARGLQIGPGLEVIALTSVAANLSAMIGGVLVFHDTVGAGPVAIGLRVVAFVLVIGGAALMPAPTRTAPEVPEEPLTT